MRSLILITYILKVTMNFSYEKKCLIAQINVDKIRSNCKNKGEPLMPLLSLVHAKNNLNTLYFFTDIDCTRKN